MEERLEAIERRLEGIEREQREAKFAVNLAVNYMREIAQIIGARERLAAIDRELAEVQRSSTAPPPSGE